MATYNVAVGGLPMASDVNQLVNIFNGSHDVGSITFAPQLSAPSTSLFTLTAQAGTTLGVGTYSYYISYVTGQYKSDGKTLVQTGETLVSSPITITTVANNTNIQIGLPTTGLPASAVAFNIYRSVVGGSSGLFLATVKFGNSSYTDSTADSALGAAAPTTNTTGTNLTVNGVLKSAQNTLDDGSGNVTVTGTVNAQSLNSSWLGGLRFVQSSSINYIESFTTNGGSTSATLKLTGANGTANTVQTYNNILDDGSGNMTVAGKVTAGQGLSSTIVIGGQNGANPFIQANYNGTTNSQLVWQIDSGSLYVDVKGSFVIRNAPNSGSPIFTVSNAGAVSSKNNTLDDGNGNATFAGNVTYKGSTYNTLGYYIDNGAMSVHAPSSRPNTDNWGVIDTNGGTVLLVNTGGTKKVATANNTLDDGNGNMSVVGSITATSGIINLNGSGDMTFQVKGKGSIGSFPGWNANVLYINAYSNGGTETASFSGGVKIKGSIFGDRNTLDDGSGNMTLGGYLVSSGHVSIKGGNALELQSASSGSWYWLDDNQGTFRISWGSSIGQNIAFQVTANEVSTIHNALDDGSGNMTLGGKLTLSYPSGGVNVPSLINNASNGTAFLDGFLNLNLQNNMGNWSIFNQDKATTPAWHQAFTVYGYGSSTPNKVTTLNNTLDDGSGNITILGAINAKSNIILRNYTSIQGYETDGSTVKNLAYVDNSNVARFGDTTISTKIDGTSVITKNNTLDDGNGSMTVHTNLFVSTGGVYIPNGAWFNGHDTSGTGHGMVMIDTGNKTLLNTDGSMGGLWTAFNGAAMSELEDGNGNMNVKNNVTVNGQLYVYNQTDFYNHVNVMPSGTATSTSNYNSQILAFGTSTWNGSSAVATWRNIFADTSNNLQISNANGTANVVTIDTGGTITIGGHIQGTDSTEHHFKKNNATANWGYYVNDSGFGAYDWKNGWGVLSYSASTSQLTIQTSKVSTNHNTLDDGAGNVTIAGTLALTGANAIKLDNYGNISAVGTTSSTWNVVDKNSVDVFYVTMSGAKSVGTSNFQIDDGNGNIVKNNGTFAIKNTNPSSGGYIVLQSLNDKVYLQSPSSMGIYCVAPNTTATYVPIAASAFNVNSMESAKTNIEAWDVSALDLIDQSVIYEYNLKAELAECINKKRHGFVIGRETPEAIIDNDAIDTYGMSALTVKAIQELNDKVAKLEALVAELLAR